MEGPGDVLDASEIYLAGTLSEGACYLDALAHWSTPNGATVGFDCYFDDEHATIRPTDGRILYTNTFENIVREFHCDGCTYDGTYPQKPLLNDTIVAPSCGSDNFYSLQFKVAPDGLLLHTCTDNPLVWYDEAGNIAYDNGEDKLLHLGYGGRALTMSRIVELATMSSVNVTGLPDAPIVTVRASFPDGFWVVLAMNDQGQDGVQELWQIDAMGIATLVRAYLQRPWSISSMKPAAGSTHLAHCSNSGKRRTHSPM